MIRVIFWKELRELVRDGRVRLVTVTVLALLLVALVAGAQRQTTLAREERDAETRSREQWDTQGDKNPHTAAHFGMYVSVPHGPLSLIDPGLTPYLGRAVWIEAHNQNPMKFRPIEDAPSLARFGDLTATLILQIIVPLLIITLGSSAFAGEREQGTLRYVLISNVKPRALALGKAGAVMVAACGALVPAAVVGAIWLASVSAMSGDLAARVAALALTYGLYYGAILALAIAVSAWVRRGRDALVILLGFWVVTTLIIPRLAADVADARHPIPAGSEFWANVDEELHGGIGHDPRDERLAKLKQETLSRYNVQRVEDLPVNFDGIALQAGEDASNAVFDRHYGALFAAYDAQAHSQLAWSWATPMLAVRAISMGLAETDSAHHRDAALAAEAYRRRVEKQLNTRIIEGSHGDDPNLTVGNSFWQSIERFQFTPQRFAEVLGREASALAIIVLWFVAAVALASVAVGRLSP